MRFHCIHTYAPSGQSHIRISVHKDLEVHQIQQFFASEGEYALKYDHVGSIHSFLQKTQREVTFLETQQIMLYSVDVIQEIFIVM